MKKFLLILSIMIFVLLLFSVCTNSNLFSGFNQKGSSSEQMARAQYLGNNDLNSGNYSAAITQFQKVLNYYNNTVPNATTQPNEALDYYSTQNKMLEAKIGEANFNFTDIMANLMELLGSTTLKAPLGTSTDITKSIVQIFSGITSNSTLNALIENYTKSKLGTYATINTLISNASITGNKANTLESKFKTYRKVRALLVAVNTAGLIKTIFYSGTLPNVTKNTYTQANAVWNTDIPGVTNVKYRIQIASNLSDLITVLGNSNTFNITNVDYSTLKTDLTNIKTEIDKYSGQSSPFNTTNIVTILSKFVL